MVMDGYYIDDKLIQLWNNINVLHLGYLEMEESPKKLENKEKLYNYIKEYLYIAPHNKKFFFRETADVLYRSACYKKDFSGYKAAVGWNAIGMYAGNLISQPWRLEYRQIKMYSGFYKHQIESNLIGAEIMFEAMGYKHEGNGILVLDGPICPDRVTNVSQDSLMAYMECQILKEIWEEVSASYKIRWLDVLKFRETYLCSPRKCVEALKYQIQQKQYQDHHGSYSQSNNDYLVNTCSRYVPSSPHLHVQSPTLPPNHSFPPLPTHNHLPVMHAPSNLINSQYICGSNCCMNNLNTYGLVTQYDYVQQPTTTYATPSIKSQGNYCCNNFNAAPAVQYNNPPVPTAQLVEVNPHALYDCPDPGKLRKKSYQLSDCSKNGLDIKTDSSTKTLEKDEISGGQFENWEYVYRNLESQGYSKDLGERGDVLNSQHASSQVTLKDTNSRDLDLINRPLKINEALDKLKEHDNKSKKFNTIRTSQNNIDTNLSSSYDNLSIQDCDVSKITKTYQVVKMKDTNQGKVDNVNRQYSKTLDVSKMRSMQGKSKNTEKTKSKIDEVSQPGIVNDNPKWQCAKCTFLNDESLRICEMCGKSRAVINDKMEIGGLQCSKCTLVNRKDSKMCEACGESLHNSPTYI